MQFDVSTSPYGPHDEIGRLNAMTPASRQRVLARIDGATVFDLSTEYFLGMPSWDMLGDPPYQIWMTHTPAGTRVDNPMQVPPAVNQYVAYSGDAISMYTHCGTHIDTLNHFGYNDEIWNHFTTTAALGTRHWRVCGSDKLASQEGTCDITPFSLWYCRVNSYRFTQPKGEISAVGRNRPFFRLLTSKDTIFGPFS